MDAKDDEANNDKGGQGTVRVKGWKERLDKMREDKEKEKK